MTITEPAPSCVAAAGRRITRRLVPAQALYIIGSSVDLTLTGIVGSRLAPVPELATLPFSLIPIVAVSTTFLLSRWIGRRGYRRVFTAAAAFAIVAGTVSATAVQLSQFWLFCVGTGLIGVYQAGAGYYRYAAAEANPDERARAVSTVLAGGLVAALLGPFLATAVSGLTATPFVASYLLVAVFGALACVWNASLPAALARAVVQRMPSDEGRDDDGPAARPRRVLWRQPVLLLGVASGALAAVAMTAMMTAGPIAGIAMGHTESDAALAVQLHMVGMFAPGFIVARWIGRIGERRVAAIGAVIIVGAGIAAAVSTQMWAFLIAMTAVGVGWNLASSGGSAMVTMAYRRAERGRVQPIAEIVTTAFQVAGSLSAGLLATAAGWHALGIAVAVLAVVVSAVLVVRHGWGGRCAERGGAA